MKKFAHETIITTKEAWMFLWNHEREIHGFKPCTAEIKRIVLEYSDECAEINDRYDRYFDQLPVNGAGETDALSLKYLNGWVKRARAAAKARYEARIAETTLLYRIV